MRQSRGVEQEVVRNVREQIPVEALAVRNLAHRPEPDVARRSRLARIQKIQRLDDPEFKRPRLLDEAPHPLTDPAEQLGGRPRRVRQRLRRRHRRHFELVIEAVLHDLKGGRHVEYLRAVLDGHDAPVGEALTVQASVDLVDDRRVEIAAAEEVGVQGMHDTALHRGAGGAERLAEHLSAKDLRAADVAAFAAKQVDLDLLELEQTQ